MTILSAKLDVSLFDYYPGQYAENRKMNTNINGCNNQLQLVF